MGSSRFMSIVKGSDMPSIGADLFVQFPSESSQRILHPGVVKQSTDGGYVVCFDEVDLSAVPGQDVLIFFEHQRQFMQQPARIDAAMEPDNTFDDEATEAPASAQRMMAGNDEPAGPTLGIEVTGDMVSAESRECFRICTVLADMFACVGDDDRCPVLDISSTGFAVIATDRYQVGERIAASMNFDDIETEGDVCIQSVRELSDGRYRYGLHCASKGSGDMANKMPRISMAVQRRQLRRMSGAQA